MFEPLTIVFGWPNGNEAEQMKGSDEHVIPLRKDKSMAVESRC